MGDIVTCDIVNCDLWSEKYYNFNRTLLFGYCECGLLNLSPAHFCNDDEETEKTVAKIQAGSCKSNKSENGSKFTNIIFMY